MTYEAWRRGVSWLIDELIEFRSKRESNGNSTGGETGDTERSLPAADGTCGDVHPLLRQRAGVVGDGDQRLVPGER